MNVVDEPRPGHSGPVIKVRCEACGAKAILMYGDVEAIAQRFRKLHATCLPVKKRRKR